MGDEVIVPPLTMSATTFSVLHANATPIFADVDAATFQISVDSVISKITKKTKAVIAVALYGLAADLPRLRKVCDDYGIFLLEDNAECYLSTVNGQLVGTFGDAASYSFQSSKHLTSGEGGMIICNSKELADRIRKVQSLGYAGVSANAAKISKEDIQSPDYSRHVSMGWNYRLAELPAAVALAQLERINDLVGARVYAGEAFNKAVEGYQHILTPQLIPEGRTHSYWTWVAALNTELISWASFREKFISQGGDPFYGAWKLTYQEPMFKDLNLLGRERFVSRKALRGYRSNPCPVAENLQPRLVQFKTNYWNREDAVRQGEILRSVLEAI
jgi:perosamine synthetase